MSDERPLVAAEREALLEALDDEYRAVATYDQVIADFGEVRPFVNIREAERRHVQALHALLSRYGIEPQPNPWPGRAPRFRSLEEACEAGVAAEIDNCAMYDRLTKATGRPDILAVFERLRAASKERHLPAFRRCASRRGGRGRPA